MPRYRPVAGRLRLVVCVVFAVILIATGAMAGQREAEFWDWFEANERMLFEFEQDQERIFDAVAEELGKVHPNLTFEFGPIK